MEKFCRQTLRFGPFELDVSGCELRRNGHPIRLERQPMDLLVLLVQRPRQLVLRTDIVATLWSSDVFVDVETGINTAVRKLRQALRDGANGPVYVETVPGRGYRFIVDVDAVPEMIGDPPVVMIAVLPFEYLGSDPEREYLADGLTEETIATLGQIDPEHLCVIGRTSSMAYKGALKSLAVIGGELNVQYLVEGSIRGEGSLLRIRCTLIRVRDQVNVWSTSYDREPISMLDVQQELSTAIAAHIRLHLSPQRLEVLSRRQTRNADAYDLYLRGRTLWNQLTPPTTRKAMEYYTLATEFDRDYALAWAGLADAYASSPMNGDAQPSHLVALAREAAAQAMRSAPDLCETQHVRGHVSWQCEWDWPDAEAAFRRAGALDASSGWPQSMLGHLLSQMGRHAEALPIMRRARELDPFSAAHHAMSSQVAFQARDYSAAGEHAREAIVIDPDFWVGYMMRGQAYEQLGEIDVALQSLTMAARLSGGNSKPISLRGYVLARVGMLKDARDVLGMLEDVARTRYVPPYAMALVHAGLGEQEAVFEWLDRAYRVRDVHLMFLTVDPKWDSYRVDSRFEALLERCGFNQATAHPTRH